MRLAVFDTLAPGEDRAFVSARRNPRVGNCFVRKIEADSEWVLERMIVGVPSAKALECPRWALYLHNMFLANGYAREDHQRWTLEHARAETKKHKTDDFTIGMDDMVFFWWSLQAKITADTPYEVRFVSPEFIIRVVLDGEVGRAS